ncbi:4'-phosphopantetheinyl transferase superfamily protein [Rhizobium laguerreae]|nr:4'-phosphopantetheinyl transferase superfamily protein [Rhizobium laguerreae]
MPIPSEGSENAVALMERVAIKLGARVAPKRAIEFACGRCCAALALRSAGAAAAIVSVGQDRKPVWPMGFVGSITHTDHYCWAAAWSTESGLGLGIDSEPILDPPTAADILSLVRTETDVASPAWLSFEEYLTILFSAKESIFKAVSSSFENILDFQDVSICALTRSNFHWRIPAHGLDRSIAKGSGRYLLWAGMCHSAVAVHR